MSKDHNFSEAMDNMGKPSEISPIKESPDSRSISPFVEVTQPIVSSEPMEITKPSRLTSI